MDDAFLQKYEIDYLAHDEEVYPSAGHDDVYQYVKSQGMRLIFVAFIRSFFFSNPIHAGKFIPTRRTPDISTSDLLERIVSGYRERDFDEKLTKMGHAKLRAEGSNYDDNIRCANYRESGSTSLVFPTRSKIE